MLQKDGGAKQSTHRGGPSLSGDFQTECERKHSVAYIHFPAQSSQQIAHATKTERRVVNYLRARALKHSTFQAFLEEVNADYKNLVYHTEVRWLSLGRVLQRFVAFKEKVLRFLKNEPKKFERLES